MPDGLNIGFAGTPELAARILGMLIDDGRHRVALVLSQPDRPAGRGRKPQYSPVKKLSESAGLPLYQPPDRAGLDMLARELAELDVLVVAAYGMILSEKILKCPGYGCINIHTSLLPRWRGAAPIQHAILAGDKETGISIMQMDAGLDTGDILYQEACPVYDNDTSGLLHDRLADLGFKCLLDTLDMIIKKQTHPRKQDDSQATYAAKILKADAKIDWNRPVQELQRLIRAMNPSPVAYTELNGTTLRIWEAIVLDRDTSNVPPGIIINYSADGLDISTKDKALRVCKLQLPGKLPLDCRDFYNGNPGFWAT